MRVQGSVLLFLFLLISQVQSAQAEDAPSGAKQEARRHFERGNDYCKAKQWNGAIAEYLEANRLYPAPAFLFNLAEVNRFAGHLRTAIDYYSRFLLAEPSGPIHDEAVGTLSRLLQQRAEEVLRHRERARADVEARDYDHAINELNIAYELDTDPSLLLALGDVYQLKPDWPQARIAYKKYLEAVPQGADSERVRQLLEQPAAKPRPAAPLPRTSEATPRTTSRTSRRALIWGLTTGAAAVVAAAITTGAVVGARDPMPSLASITVDLGRSQ